MAAIAGVNYIVNQRHTLPLAKLLVYLFELSLRLAIFVTSEAATHEVKI